MDTTKFYCFGGHNYYPAGGFNDFLDVFDTLEEAEELWHNQHRFDWFQIVEIKDAEVVNEYNYHAKR